MSGTKHGLSLAILTLGSLLAGGSAPAASTAADTAAAASANLSLGVAYLRQGNLPVAKDKLERAAEQNPRDVKVQISLALLYERLNDPPAVEQAYKTALRLAPADPEVNNNYAVYLCRKGKVDEGVKRFEQAGGNKLYGTPWAAYTNAGVCLRGAGRDAEAEKQFGRALSINPNYGEAILQLGELELATQRATSAWQRVALYLNANAANADLLYLGWRAARTGNDTGNAQRMAQRLQAEFPGSAYTRATLAAAKSR